MEKFNINEIAIPCRRCGKTQPIGIMSKKLICATCVGIATIMSGKTSAEVKKRMKKEREKEVAENEKN